tara:strand:+ start:273 stop:533 length:261 start_codon:yes stop_codon:yes gene_type:complete
VLLFDIVLGSPPEQMVCAFPIEPVEGADITVTFTGLVNPDQSVDEQLFRPLLLYHLLAVKPDGGLYVEDVAPLIVTHEELLFEYCH